MDKVSARQIDMYSVKEWCTVYNVYIILLHYMHNLSYKGMAYGNLIQIILQYERMYHILDIYKSWY